MVHVLSRAFSVVWGRDGHNLVLSRIQVLRQPADIASFAGRVPPLVGDDNGQAPQIDLVLQLTKLRLCLLQPGNVLFVA
jgi:hypothetical protein